MGIEGRCHREPHVCLIRLRLCLNQRVDSLDLVKRIQAGLEVYSEPGYVMFTSDIHQNNFTRPKSKSVRLQWKIPFSS